MATRGTKPKPTALKTLEGNPGKRKINKNEPKSIAETFIDGYIEITEFPDQYMFHIDYDNTNAAPSAIANLNTTVEEIKPAHLAFQILSYFISWTRYDGFDYTWTKWDGLDLTWSGWETYHEGG